MVTVTTSKTWWVIAIVSVCLIIAFVLPAFHGRPGPNELKLAAKIEEWDGRAIIHDGLFRGADLSRTNICNEDLVILRREILKLRYPRSLREIDLSDTQISDRGIENLEGLESHQLSLLLNRTNISDSALTIIAQDFVGLHTLGLMSTAVTGDGLARLRRHPTLKAVDVSGPNITAEVIDRLNNLEEENVTFYFPPRWEKGQESSLGE